MLGPTAILPTLRGMVIAEYFALACAWLAVSVFVARAHEFYDLEVASTTDNVADAAFLGVPGCMLVATLLAYVAKRTTGGRPVWKALAFVGLLALTWLLLVMFPVVMPSGIRELSSST